MIRFRFLSLPLLLAPTLAFAAEYLSGDCVCERTDIQAVPQMKNSGVVAGKGVFSLSYAHDVTGGDDGQCSQDGCDQRDCDWIYTPTFTVSSQAGINVRWKFRVRRFVNGSTWTTIGTSAIREGDGSEDLDFSGLTMDSYGCNDPGTESYKVLVSWDSRPTSADPWDNVWSTYGLIATADPAFNCGECPDIDP